MLGRVSLAFLATIALSLGILWMRGELQFRPDARSLGPEPSGAGRQVTLAVTGMH